MQAIILAAGMGKRLKDLTANNTKCMVKVNGITLIERMLCQLDKQNLNRIVIVVGYESSNLKNFISTLSVSTSVEYIENPVYDKTNNIYSLALAKDKLIEDDTLLLESDLIFEDGVLEELIAAPYPTLALVDKYESWMDGTVVELGEDNSITSFIPGKRFCFERINNYYKTVNIYKFSKSFSSDYYVPFLMAYSTALGNNEYYEQVLRVITMLDSPEIQAKKMNGKLWYEIDDIQDLDIAESMFGTDDEKLELLFGHYGGYWRYPKLLDFCYLVNPYFPPQRLIDEMKASFEKLLVQYPSGMRINSLLAAKNFGVKQSHIAIGNGAAELIKELMGMLDGNVGFIRPTFEEYPNRYCNGKSIVFTPPDDNDFSYSVNDLTTFFADKNLHALVLINPDNPTGHYLLKNDICKLALWAQKNNVVLIVDESFADFADEPDNSIIHEDIMKQYPSMVIVKSISKSYGIPGIRLGVIASGNEELIKNIKEKVAIWNINSFGEFYMQIAEKYQKDYKEALIRFRTVRTHFIEALGRIPNIRVLPTQANFVMIEFLGNISPKIIVKRLAFDCNILIKDLSSKLGYTGKKYIRVAVRSEDENNRFIHAITTVLGELQ